MAWDAHRVMQLVELHEGFRRTPYKDTEGILTVGIGFNLDDVGLSRAESLVILEGRLEALRGKLRDKFVPFRHLNAVRQAVLVDMAYNLGLRRLTLFRRMWNALDEGDYRTAAVEMLDSKWATQVGPRAKRLAYMMEIGEWPENL